MAFDPITSIDMSPQAIARRLDEVRALYLLTISLGKARIVGPVEATRRVSAPR